MEAESSEIAFSGNVIAVAPFQRGSQDENDNEREVVKKMKTTPPGQGPEEGSLEVKGATQDGDGAVDGGDDDKMQSPPGVVPLQDGPRPTKRLSSGAPAPAQRLDVPSKELQAIQKQVMVERLMMTGAGSAAPAGGNEEEEPMDAQEASGSEGAAQCKPSKKPIRPSKIPVRKTFKLRSSLLDTAKSFLVEMKTANEELLSLPDPSKISLESDSDPGGDEMDSGAPQPGTSASFKKVGGDQEEEEEEGSKTYVEMNLALVDHSDSDTSSDDENFKLNKRM